METKTMSDIQSVLRFSGTAMAVSLAFVCNLANADEAQLQQQIRELAGKLDSLQQQLDATKKPAAQGGNEQLGKGELPGSFKIPGTETSLKLGGFAYLDIIKDFNGGGQGGTVGIVQNIPVEGSAAATRSGQFTMTARRSRLYATALTPTSLGNLKTHLEADFYGAGGNELVTNSAGFRLRQAYADIGSWTFGQTYTTFVDLPSYPEIVDFSGGHGLPQGARQPLVRYAQKAGAHEFAVAIENPESDFVGVSTQTFAAGTGPVNQNSIDKSPDLAAKYAVSGAWGRLAVAGVARRLTVNNNGGTALNGFTGEKSVTAGGLMMSGRLMTFGTDSVTFAVAGGPGIGRYLLGLPANTAAVINNGKLDTVDAWGGNLSYRHYWTPSLRSTASYGVVRSDNPHPAIPATNITRIQAGYLNLIWSPTPVTNFGLEYVHANVRNDATPTASLSNEGSADRLSLAMQYAF